MAVAAFLLSVLALVLSAVSVAYTRRTTHAQEAEDRRVRTPDLTLTPERPADGAASVIYEVRNDGPQDLESLVIHRPRTADGVVYPIGEVGRDWAEDEVELGPLGMTASKRFMLCVGSRSEHPDFRVLVLCRAGRDRWQLAFALEVPAPGVGVY